MVGQNMIAPSYNERLGLLREEKLVQTQEKQALFGEMDHDDWAIILPPIENRLVIEAKSSSGMPLVDAVLKDFIPESNHASGSFFGPEICGLNLRKLLEIHPVYLDPYSSLAGAYMVNFMSYRNPHWNPDINFEHLIPEQKKYNIISGIGAVQHMCPDLKIGLDLGWGGILDKVYKYRDVNGTDKRAFYAGLEHVVLGMQNWIQRHADAAQKLAQGSDSTWMRQNLEDISAINQKLIEEPPETFREACQWILWYLMLARMHNGSGALGKFDALLWPYYKKDVEAGILTDEEALFHIACLLLRDTTYFQLGGPDVESEDNTNHLSYLILEAAYRLKIPVNAGVCVGKHTDERLFRRGIEIIFENKQGVPKFLGIDNVINGAIQNGFPSDVAVERPYSGCNWHGAAGREYMIGDSIKINLAAVLNVSLQEMFQEYGEQSSTDILWAYYEEHLKRAVEVAAQGVDIHLENMHKVFPELVLDLCCYGPLEKGLDASHGGVEITNINIDGAGLATAANSFASLKQHLDVEKRISWSDLMQHLEKNWHGREGERTRLLMKNTPHFGFGRSLGDEYASRIADLFRDFIHQNRTPAGHKMTPGFFGWVHHIQMGKMVGATPDGRYADAEISHGANPSPGFREDGAPTALALSVAAIQPGLGCPAPLQLDMDPTLANDPGWIDKMMTLIKTHFDLGGTQINLNVVDGQKILEANQDPSKYPDLIVRVTGFSAYFSSLSPELRKIVVDRIVAAE